MPRPKTKQDLIDTANTQYDKLLNLIESLGQNSQDIIFDFDDKLLAKAAHWKRDKNLRDILVHLYEWHKLLLNWVQSNQSGINKQFLVEGYNWKTYGEMNVEFWKQHQNTSYEKSMNLFKESHVAIMKLIDGFSEDELFSKDHYDWVGGSTLGQYCVSVTSSHYDWAMNKIKEYIKTL